MACYHPLEGYRARWVNPSGRRPIVFNSNEGFVDLPVKVPCGQCIGCRLECSRQWAMRCVHEAQMHDSNCFITLTYDDVHLPYGASLVKKHFQDFMKRLRKHFHDSKLMYFHCGEYGDVSNRPHYHAIIFGLDFSDKILYKQSVKGSSLFISPTLSKLWPFGFSTVGDCTFDSAAYVARYVLKKVTGSDAEDHYIRFDSATGEVFHVQPEYVTMSLKPAIGLNWYRTFKDDVFPDDFVIIKGQKVRPPKFYFGQYEIDNPEMAAFLKHERIKRSVKFAADNTPQRLLVRETVKKSQISKLCRKDI